MTRGPAVHGSNENPLPAGIHHAPQRLLALYPGLRHSGWAILEVFHTGALSPEVFRTLNRVSPRISDAGVAGLDTRKKLQPSERVAHQVQALESVCSRWQPDSVVHSVPSGMGWGNPGLRLLEDALHNWAGDKALPLIPYPASDVRSAIAGKPNAPKRALGFAVMHRFGLIGQDRSDLEWEAIAVGYYHLLASPGLLESSGCERL